MLKEVGCREERRRLRRGEEGVRCSVGVRRGGNIVEYIRIVTTGVKI
jgi:hypothetical protein